MECELLPILDFAIKLVFVVIAWRGLRTYRANNLQVAQIKLCSDLFESLDAMGTKGFGKLSTQDNRAPISDSDVHESGNESFQTALDTYFRFSRNLANIQVLMPPSVLPVADKAGKTARKMVEVFRAGELKRVNPLFNELVEDMEAVKVECRRAVRADWPSHGLGFRRVRF